MASAMSMSASGQASVIIEQQMKQKLQEEDPQLHRSLQLQQNQQEQQQKKANFCLQLLLVSALFGIEMTVSFEQTYEIPIHQYLGVPVSLVSLNGAISGVVSILLLQVMGFFTDRGNNPVFRKLLTLIFGLLIFTAGFGMLAVCGFIKIQSFQSFLNNQNTSEPQNITASETDRDDIAPVTHDESSLDSLEISSLPVTVLLSIAGFTCLDVGFDLCVALIRAFILECTPDFQHTQLLVLATVTQSLAGTTCSFIGIFDLPGAFGSMFNVDGTAAMLIFFCCLLTAVVGTGFTTTMCTGYIVGRRTKSQAPGDSKDSPNSQTGTTEDMPKRAQPKTRNKLMFLRRNTKEVTNQAVDHKPYVADILHTEEGATQTRPLLLEDSLKGQSYAAVADSGLAAYQNVDLSLTEEKFGTMYPAVSSSDVSCLDDLDVTDNQKDDLFKESQTDADGDVSEGQEGHNDEELAQKQRLQVTGEQSTRSVVSALRRSYSLSHSVIQQSPFDDFHARKINALDVARESQITEAASKNVRRLRFRLAVLFLASFFAMGGMIGYMAYMSNAVTIGIMHGDPAALPGTEGRELYDKGLRTSALGSLVMYSCYAITSLNARRIINRVGEEGQFVLCNVFVIILFVPLILTQYVELYYVAMAAAGAFRTCVFTLPYVIAHKVIQEEKQTPQATDGQTVGTSNIGKIVPIIGCLIPAHFTLLSLFMGPLIDATENVWAPIMYTVAACVASVICILPLFRKRDR